MRDDDLPPLPELAPGHYRHYKGGQYEVLGVVRHSETLEALVLYRALHGQMGLWVRPAAMFTESVCIDGQPRLRFEKTDTAEETEDAKKTEKPQKSLKKA